MPDGYKVGGDTPSPWGDGAPVGIVLFSLPMVFKMGGKKKEG